MKTDRKITFSYNSMLFLQRHGFRLESAFADGVPYLSRAEEADLHNDFLAKTPHLSREPIDLASQSRETQVFYDWACRSVQQWMEDPAGVSTTLKSATGVRASF